MFGLSSRRERDLALTRAQRNEIVFQEGIFALRDLRDEIRAQRGALLALIDEIRGGGPQPQTG